MFMFQVWIRKRKFIFRAMYFAQVAKIGFFPIKSNKIFRQSEVTSDDEVAIIIIILPPLLIYDFIFLNLKATQHFWPM